jgi:hypothetical protein
LTDVPRHKPDERFGSHYESKQEVEFKASAGVVARVTVRAPKRSETRHRSRQQLRKVVVAASIDGTTTFGAVGAIQISAAPGNSGSPLARATLDAATTERTMLLAEIYRRGPVWRLRAVGQGYDHGLDALARGYGVDISD